MNNNSIQLSQELHQILSMGLFTDFKQVLMHQNLNLNHVIGMDLIDDLNDELVWELELDTEIEELDILNTTI